MKRSFQIQLNRIEARIPYDSLKRAEADQAYNEILTQSEPESWEWILTVNPKEVEEFLPPSQQENNHFLVAYLLAHTRGWDKIGIAVNEYAWRFSLYTAAHWHEEGKNDWGILYLMGLTPAQFEALPADKRQDLLDEARNRVEARLQELGPQIDALRHPKELFQAIRDLNLSELCKIIR
ncbi:MAG: hypothetical protein NPIRA05_17020 [Nitrospirales bacterium]|nr:MAG: hypothetical protein NPIRA05_17020 [Nitrospirales bacterium]